MIQDAMRKNNHASIDTSRYNLRSSNKYSIDDEEFTDRAFSDIQQENCDLQEDNIGQASPRELDSMLLNNQMQGPTDPEIINRNLQNSSVLNLSSNNSNHPGRAQGGFMSDKGDQLRMQHMALNSSKSNISNMSALSRAKLN